MANQMLVLPFLLLILHSLQSTVKIRSAWLDASQCPDEKTTEDVIKVMAENGINRIYAVSWKRGQVFYPSETMFSAIGNEGIGRMIIPWSVKYGHVYKMQVYAWFEYGYIASYMNLSNPFGEYAEKQGWIMGEVNHMFYMDPSKNGTNFLAGIMKDCIDTGVDGLQLDDHFSCRKKFPQCNQKVLQTAAASIYKAIRIKNLTIPISLAPAPMPESLTEYSVNWPQLFAERAIDEVVPLLYTSNSQYFEKMLLKNEGYMRKELKEKTLIGVMVNLDSNTSVTKWNETLKMIELTNKHLFGAVIWYGKAVVNDYKKEFHDLWGNNKTGALES